MTTASEQASEAAPATPEVPAQPTTAVLPTTAADIKSISDALYAKPKAADAPAAPVPEVPAEPVVPEVVAEPEAPKEPEVAAEPVVAESVAKVLPHRISTNQFTPIEQEAIALGKQLKDAGEEVPGLEERIAIVRQRHTEAAKPAPEVPAAETAETVAAQLAGIDAQLEQLGDSEAPFTKETAKLIRERTDLVAKLLITQRNEADAASAQKAQFDSLRKDSIAEAKRLMPAAADETSLLNNRIASLHQDLKNPAHPNHGNLHQANAPLLIANMAAMNLAAEIASAEKIPLTEALAKAIGMTTKPAPAAAPATAQAPKPGIVAPKITPASGAASPTPVASPATNAPSTDPLKFDPKKSDEWMGKARGGKQYILGH